MAKFTKAEMKKSLLEGVSLVERGNDFKWVEFHELADAYANGYMLVNEEKMALYERMRS